MTDPGKQLQTYGRLGVVIDANLLLLFFLGSYDRKQILTNRRLATFTPEDFDLLIKLLDRFERIITTPNILTEVSNLSGAVHERNRQAYFDSFAARVTLLDEQHVVSATALTTKWSKFGLTDAVIAAGGEEPISCVDRRLPVVSIPAE